MGRLKFDAILNVLWYEFYTSIKFNIKRQDSSSFQRKFMWLQFEVSYINAVPKRTSAPTVNVNLKKIDWVSALMAFA